MTIAATGQVSFEGGEISPQFQGRIDNPRYKNSLDLCRNWLATLSGSARRRPGSAYIATALTLYSRLIPFEFSTTQAYQLEFTSISTQGVIRIFANYALVTNTTGSAIIGNAGQSIANGAAYTIYHNYANQDIAGIRFVQSADTLYLVHPNYPPAKVQRFGALSWTLTNINFRGGPFISINSNQNININWPSSSGNTIYSAPVAGQTGSGPYYQAITGCASASGLVQVTIAGHGWTTGQIVQISSVVGTTEANGTWAITVTGLNTFTLQGSKFVNAYISGGKLYPMLGCNDVPLGPGSFSTLFMGVGALGSTFAVQFHNQWGWGTITALSSAFACEFAMSVESPGYVTGGFTGSFALGLWGPGNYPSCVGFHQDRLTFSGQPLYPQAVNASVSSDYENFSPFVYNQFDTLGNVIDSGTVLDSSALSFNLNANDVNFNYWINSDEKGMLVGSSAAEWLIRPNTEAGAITPTNISTDRGSKWGSAPIDSVKVDRATLYAQRGARRIRELYYYFDIDGFRSTDVTEEAEHITGAGVVQLAYQEVPLPILWVLRSDGVLLGLNYKRDIFQVKTGWHQHVLGGQSDPTGSAPIITSISVIPDPTGKKDDLWMTVQRYINGETVYTIEYLTKILEDFDLLPLYPAIVNNQVVNPYQVMPYFVDCGITFSNPLQVIVSPITLGNPVSLNVTAHGLSTGQKIKITGVRGPFQLNNNIYTITKVDNNNFTLNGINGAAWSSSFSLIASNYGLITPLTSTISGLDYLDGETVSVFADGATQAPQIVSSGSITLQYPGAIVNVGYNYNSDLRMLRLEAGSRNGIALGKIRRTHLVTALVHNSQGLMIGPNFQRMDRMEYRTSGVDETTGPPALISGILYQQTDFDYDMDNMICFRVSDPFPCDLIAVMPQMETQDNA